MSAHPGAGDTELPLQPTDTFTDDVTEVLVTDSNPPPVVPVWKQSHVAYLQVLIVGFIFFDGVVISAIGGNLYYYQFWVVIFCTASAGLAFTSSRARKVLLDVLTLAVSLVAVVAGVVAFGFACHTVDRYRTLMSVCEAWDSHARHVPDSWPPGHPFISSTMCFNHDGQLDKMKTAFTFSFFDVFFLLAETTFAIIQAVLAGIMSTNRKT